MSLINIINVTFGYDNGRNVFENVSLQIDTNWKLGLIGRNGKGKTTFLKLLLGELEHAGQITHTVEFDFFPFEIKNKEITTLEIINSIVLNLEEWKLYKEFNLLNLDADCLLRPFKTLSGGEQSKVMLAALFLKENNFLLIDEPTNHLDAKARKIIGSYLKGKKGFIVVSHDRIFLDCCVDHILSINKANIEIQKGNFSSWNINKERQDNFETVQSEKLATQIEKLKKAAKNKANWSNKAEKEKIGNGPCDRGFIRSKAAKAMKTAVIIKNRQEEAINQKTKLLKNIETKEQIKLVPLKHWSENLAEIKNLKIFYGENTVFSNLNFSIKQGDRIALLGVNGSGKSSILKLFTGENITHSGLFKTANGLIISYVQQDTSFLKGSLNNFAKENKIDETLLKSVLFKLDFSRTQFENNIEDFSNGQKKKVLIAKSLCENAHLYIWDEPLNYIDVFSRIQIEETILKHKPTMLFVEHDQTFVSTVATKTVLIEK